MDKKADDARRQSVWNRIDPTLVWSAVISAISAVAVAWITASYRGETAGAQAGGMAGATAGERRVDELVEIPAGTVSFFNRTGCPEGWRIRADAQGRYLVGVNPRYEGSLNEVQGDPLTNLENRAVGKHSHQDRTYQVGGSEPGSLGLGWGAAERQSLTLPGLPPESTREFRNNVDGTNAPYLQLLVCEKER